MEHIERIKESLCKITWGNEEGIIQGTGVFITPFLVLTAQHIIRRAPPSQILFENNQGHRSHFLLKARGGTHHQDKKMDIALLELTDPIGPHAHTRVISTPKFKRETEGYLVTNFTNDPRSQNIDAYPIELDTLTTLFLKNNAEGRNKSAEFTTTFQAGPGHSGSPIVDKNGKIISILSRVDIPPGTTKSDILKQQGEIMSESVKIEGPAPEEVASFINHALSMA